MELFLVDALGVTVAAISGVIAGRGRGIDLFGACFLGFVTCFGGGTVRDLILGVPVAWKNEPRLLVWVFIVAVATFFATKNREDARWIQGRIFWWADAGTLAVFSIAGCAKAHAHGVSIPVALILGMTTGVAGGILRDTLIGQLPLVFRRDQHFYATAALVGSGIYLMVLPLWQEFSIPLGVASVLVTRHFSRRFDVKWPAFSDENEMTQI